MSWDFFFEGEHLLVGEPFGHRHDTACAVKGMVL